MPRLFLALLASLLVFASVRPAQVEAAPAAIDPVGARAFFAAPAADGEGPAIGMADANGRVVHLPTTAVPTQVAVSPALRRAIVLHTAANLATLVDTDTLRASTVITGMNPFRVVIVEKTATAYVLGKGIGLDHDSGTLTQIDLRSGLARTYPVRGFTPMGATANPQGTRIYVVGTILQRASEWMPGYVQAFDTIAQHMEGDPQPLARAPREILAAGEEVFVVGHVDRETSNADGRKGVRPVLFQLDGASLALKRTILLPDPAGRRAAFEGRAEIAPATHDVYLLEGERLHVVVPAAGHVRTVPLEAPGTALALDAASGTLLVGFASTGQVGVFNLAGDRLDTLAAARGGLEGLSALAVDGATAYVAGAGTLTALRGVAGAGVVSFTDLWVDPQWPGSGVFVDQQGATIFATLFTQDLQGNPVWLFMSNGARQADGSFAGDLYRTRGPLAEATKNVSAVGSLRFVPARDDKATLISYVDGALQTRRLQRFRVSEAPRECRWSVGDTALPGERANFTGFWSNPADPGWGLAITQQGDSAFAVLFDYDDQNRASWAVMSNGKRAANGTFSGDVYRAAGGRIEPAGTLSLAFSGPVSGTLRYRLSGLNFQGPILRHTFAKLTTRCTS